MPRSATANIDVDTGIPVGIAGPRKRIYYFDDFNLVPGLEIGATTIANTPTGDQVEHGLEVNKDWKIVGTNSDQDVLALATDGDGGIDLTTAGALADQAILLPTTSATVKSGLNVKTWDTDKRPAAEWCFSTTSTITSMTAWCGFTTAAGAVRAPYDVTHDDNQVKVEYIAGSNFIIRYSTDAVLTNTYVDYAIDTGIAVAASTTYVVKIALDSDRVAWVSIANAADLGAAVEIPTKYALKDVTTLIPTIGVQDDTTAAKQIAVHYVALGRDRGVGDPL